MVSPMRPRLLAALSCAAIVAGAFVAPTFAADPPGVTTTNGCIWSVPELGTTKWIKICYTLFKPAGASKSHQVPMVMHSHGWGSSRTTTASSFEKYLDAGFGVLSFDQRGFGQSGGKARVESPDYEGRDVERL